MTRATISRIRLADQPARAGRAAATARKMSRTPRTSPGHRRCALADRRAEATGRGMATASDRRHADERRPDERRRVDEPVSRPVRVRSRRSWLRRPPAPPSDERSDRGVRVVHAVERDLVDLAGHDAPGRGSPGRPSGSASSSLRETSEVQRLRGRGPARCRSVTGRRAKWVWEWTMPQKTSSASSVAMVRRSRSVADR